MTGRERTTHRSALHPKQAERRDCPAATQLLAFGKSIFGVRKNVRDVGNLSSERHPPGGCCTTGGKGVLSHILVELFRITKTRSQSVKAIVATLSDDGLLRFLAQPREPSSP